MPISPNTAMAMPYKYKVTPYNHGEFMSENNSAHLETKRSETGSHTAAERHHVKPSPPSHVLTYDVKTKDGLIFPNRAGTGNQTKDGLIDSRLELAPTNGKLTVQTYDQYVQRLGVFREGKRSLRLGENDAHETTSHERE